MRIFHWRNGLGSQTSVGENPTVINTQSTTPWPAEHGASFKLASLHGGDYVLLRVVQTYKTPLEITDVDTLLYSLPENDSGILMIPSRDYFLISVVEIVKNEKAEE